MVRQNDNCHSGERIVYESSLTPDDIADTQDYIQKA